MTAYAQTLSDTYSDMLESILGSAGYLLSDLKPSDWVEQNRTMGTDETSVPGPFRLDETPYLKEILNRVSPTDPSQIIAIMKGAQIGMSTGVIESAIGYIIAQSPGNILFLSGHKELSEEAMNGKIDKMIESCGLRDYIKPSVVKRKNSRTGDTTKFKEFPGGSVVAGSASNHKLLRQRSVRYAFIDDYDAAKKSTKESGSTKTMIMQRLAAYADKMKVFFISTPELEDTSNIEPAYLLGDQRRWFIECPCCGEKITLEWEEDIEGQHGEKGGIIWQLDENDKLIVDSVRYRCQKCGDYFDESIKHDLVKAGEFIPTAEPSQEGYYSYHISCLYAPAYMFGWEYYVRMYLEANPPGGKKDEKKHQTFLNLCLGKTYKRTEDQPEAKLLQNNIRNYDINAIPEKMSIADGNGEIVLLTCACDLNGTEEDARLDYEILAWPEKDGVSYSIRQGSIGTFIPGEKKKKDKEDRERWTYNTALPNSVWPELDKILNEIFVTDTPFPMPDDLLRVGRRMKVAITGVDTGHFTDFAYHYIDNSNLTVVGVRGDKESKFRKHDADAPSFKYARERKSLFLIDVNYVKDKLSSNMRLKWRYSDLLQPPGFMNFPIPSGGKYLYQSYFSHFEAEHKIPHEETNGDISFRWVKRQTNLQNHFFDVRVYNMALRDIAVDVVAKELKLKSLNWQEYCKLMLGK